MQRREKEKTFMRSDQQWSARVQLMTEIYEILHFRWWHYFYFVLFLFSFFLHRHFDAIQDAFSRCIVISILKSAEIWWIIFLEVVFTWFMFLFQPSLPWFNHHSLSFRSFGYIRKCVCLCIFRIVSVMKIGFFMNINSFFSDGFYAIQLLSGCLFICTHTERHLFFFVCV